MDDRGAGMDWRVTIELSGADGMRRTHEVARGGCTDPHSTLDPLGLTLDDGKTLLAGVQRHLVQARVPEYSAAPPLLALPQTPPAEGYAHSAIDLAVWPSMTSAPTREPSPSPTSGSTTSRNSSRPTRPIPASLRATGSSTDLQKRWRVPRDPYRMLTMQRSCWISVAP